MIPPIYFIWKQLNGPQIKAVVTAAWERIVSWFDSTIEYFYHFSVATVNSAHLTLIGTLVGFQRPIVTKIDETYFYFSEVPPVPNSKYGLSHRPGPPDNDGDDPYNWGGQFASLSGSTTAVGELADTEWYRQMLDTFLSSKGEAASFVALDDITHSLSIFDSPERPPYYVFTFYQNQGPDDARANGDIDLDLDNILPWHDPFTALQLMRSLAAGMYAPVPVIRPILQGVDSITGGTTTDFSKKLLQFLSPNDLWIKDVSGRAQYKLTEDDFPEYYNEEGQRAVKWNTKPDGSGEPVEIGYQLLGNVILYAYPVEFI